MRTIPRIDCHHHLWRPSRYSYPWLQPDAERPTAVFPDLTPIAGDYWIDDYLANVRATGVVKSVHLDSGYVPEDPVGETRLLQRLADEYGFPHGIVARAALERPDIQATLEAQRQFVNLRGVRHILNWHPDAAKRFTARSDWMQDSRWLKGFSLLARRFPVISLILNHAGMPLDQDRAGRHAWQKGLRQLAACENVTVKISGLGMVFPDWRLDKVSWWVGEILTLFGVHRVMFASNFPVDKLYGSLRDLYQTFDRLTAALTDDEAAAVFYRNAARVYQLGD